METFEQSLSINAPAERVYTILKQVERYPEFIQHVRTVRVLERSQDGACILLEWQIVVPGVGIETKWQSEGLWDDARYRATFRPVGEALAPLQGEWQVVPEGEGARLALHAQYQLNVPSLFKGMAQRAVEENLQRIMEAIKLRAEQG